jgi:hypothetical protein
MGCFGYKMSLKTESAMLSIDDQSEQQIAKRPGRDPVFLKASEAAHFAGEKKEEVYAWVSECLWEQNWDQFGVRSTAWCGGILFKLSTLRITYYPGKTTGGTSADVRHRAGKSEFRRSLRCSTARSVPSASFADDDPITAFRQAVLSTTLLVRHLSGSTPSPEAGQRMLRRSTSVEELIKLRRCLRALLLACCYQEGPSVSFPSVLLAAFRRLARATFQTGYGA